MDTIATRLTETIQRLETAGIDNARFEARLLLCHVLDVELQVLIGYPEREISTDQVSSLEDLLIRRENREPMSHILGEREFWSLPFKVTKDTLTPRPDSETLVEAVLKYLPDPTQELRVLDLGVGTGCLLLSILSEYEQATGLGIDISPKALDVAIENAKRLGFEDRSRFQIGNWAEGIDETFDLVLSNPPYIPLSDEKDLEPEVKEYEPAGALFAGVDGLDDYRKLAECLPYLLKNQGFAVIELGIGQAEAVTKLMTETGLEVIEAPRDLSEIERCLVIRKKL
ncbi:peptide chain release factor N(5)-glutamine methyltransferase [Terasakiella sp. SH-1]|uniref:peptide chain release factor N(5)-glutamine methyltransferase n=1 Tax=Terasakiella sp. SH-1 TaxID=2560057 RepID=UPI0010739AE6|nr:peptide chain release factor N(5)-glutamine methyltransferase [Terasakiella sp. SH-1]